uniref:Uncharacterized protein n=1 Tax=Aegilops tauschii subsp. strangulata TaxID=200361 RepID=A0A453PIB9_AEGTS
LDQGKDKDRSGVRSREREKGSRGRRNRLTRWAPPASVGCHLCPRRRPRLSCFCSPCPPVRRWFPAGIRSSFIHI